MFFTACCESRRKRKAVGWVVVFSTEFSFRTKQFNVLSSLLPFLFALQCFQEHCVYSEDCSIMETHHCCLGEEFPILALARMWWWAHQVLPYSLRWNKKPKLQNHLKGVRNDEWVWHLYCQLNLVLWGKPTDESLFWAVTISRHSVNINSNI